MRESAFSEVATMIWFLPRYSSRLSISPLERPTFMPRSENRENAACFSEARARRGTM